MTIFGKNVTRVANRWPIIVVCSFPSLIGGAGSAAAAQQLSEPEAAQAPADGAVENTDSHPAASPAQAPDTDNAVVASDAQNETAASSEMGAEATEPLDEVASASEAAPSVEPRVPLEEAADAHAQDESAMDVSSDAGVRRDESSAEGDEEVGAADDLTVQTTDASGHTETAGAASGTLTQPTSRAAAADKPCFVIPSVMTAQRLRDLIDAMAPPAVRTKDTEVIDRAY